MAHFLVTGGAGFIGSNLVEALVANGDRVRVLDNFLTGKAHNLEAFRDRIELVEGSIIDLQTCHRAVDGVDYVLHQAALPSVPKSIKMPVESNQANVMGIVNMLVAARDAKVKRFVFAASSSAYGDTPTLPKSEEMPVAPKSPYAIQKVAGEMYCKTFFDVYGLQTVALRYFNIFGPRQDPTSFYSAVIPKFIAASINNEAPTINGDGLTSRDFTYIANAIQANLKACTAPPACAGHVMNIACGTRITLNDLAAVVREKVGRGLPPVHGPERAGDVKHSLASIEKAEKLLGYRPEISFAEGIARTVEWYRAHLNPQGE
ncbi:MAG: SDR family oxidoreductase [Myxococcota bacterium]